ncbi:hypothetical protein WJX77_008842 [Trebouxia sp. C0004]
MQHRVEAVPYMCDVNRCIKARQQAYKNNQESESWKASLAKVKVYFHKQRHAASKKQSLRLQTESQSQAGTLVTKLVIVEVLVQLS